MKATPIIVSASVYVPKSPETYPPDESFDFTKKSYDSTRTGKLAEAMKINAEASSIVSSGPFVLEAANPGERIDYARNAHYWKKDAKGTQLPYLDKMSADLGPHATKIKDLIRAIT